MKSICVFAGSGVGSKPGYSEAALLLGKAIADMGLHLVYGGGNIGLMRVIADSVLDNGGKVTGVMPKSIVEKEIAHLELTELHVVDTMHQRKALMAELSDAFIALPGGFGTCDELFEVLTWNQLEIIRKPLGLLNVDHYYDHLMTFMDHMVEEKFLRAEHRRNVIADSNPDELLRRISGFRFLKAEKWIDRLKMNQI